MQQSPDRRSRLVHGDVNLAKGVALDGTLALKCRGVETWAATYCVGNADAPHSVELADAALIEHLQLTYGAVNLDGLTVKRYK
jgi:hypothetical protein